MHIKLVIICTLFCHSLMNATFIKGKAKVYSFNNHVPFAVLYESTYVIQSVNIKGNKIWIDFDGLVKKSDFPKKQVGIVTYQLTDTVFLYSDYKDLKVVGYIWPSNDSASISIHDDSDEDITNYHRCYLSGLVDSNSIMEFNPWNTIVVSLNNRNQLFNLPYNKLSDLMRSINNDCTSISGVGDEYSQSYDEERPTPNHALISFFRNGKLKAIWADVDLDLKNKVKVKYGYLYYDDSIKSKVAMIKKDIIDYLNYTP